MVPKKMYRISVSFVRALTRLMDENIASNLLNIPFKKNGSVAGTHSSATDGILLAIYSKRLTFPDSPYDIKSQHFGVVPAISPILLSPSPPTEQNNHSTIYPTLSDYAQKELHPLLLALYQL